MKPILPIVLLASSIPAQLGWQPAAPTNRTGYGCTGWCDTSVTPNEVFTFGGSEDGFEPEAEWVTRYHKTATGWQWSRTANKIPTWNHPLYGDLKEWWHGKAAFVTQTSNGTVMNKALCISSHRGGGVYIGAHHEVWTYDRVQGFEPVTVIGTPPPEDLGFFSMAYVPYSPNIDGSGKVYVYGGHVRNFVATTNLYVLDHVSGNTWSWSTLTPSAVGVVPGRVYKSSLVWHPTEQALYLTGGWEVETWSPVNDKTWICTLGTLGSTVIWLDASMAGQSLVAWHGPVVYESTYDVLFRFGGSHRYSYETYPFFETTRAGLPAWYLVSGFQPTPPDRAGHAMVFMPSESQFLMWGGWQRRTNNPPSLRLPKDAWIFKAN